MSNTGTGTGASADMQVEQKDDIFQSKFSPEERKIIEDCRWESTIYRAGPLSLVFYLSAHYAINSGLMTTKRVRPIVAKLGFASLGYLVGRASYLGEVRRRIVAYRSTGYSTSSVSPSHEHPQHNQVEPSYTDVDDKGRDYDTSTPPPESSGLDDSLRPSLDSSSLSSPEEKKDTPVISTSYDDLRRKNREAFKQKELERLKKVKDFGRHPWTQPQPLGEQKPNQPQESKRPKKKINKYGDEMD